ncbi:hypothetical protein [Paenibacillus sp. CFBP 13594]|uniref:hypothetical protein n=1 Tax=Paenibacillus sp. CFBP 13594 TaxID=2774037 RepID=UPI001A7E658A|nr:hypothetical protein [Paenibacillus sp. CFBP 13594]
MAGLLLSHGWGWQAGNTGQPGCGPLADPPHGAMWLCDTWLCVWRAGGLSMSLPIEKHPGNLLPEMGRMPGCFGFFLPISHGQRTGL